MWPPRQASPQPWSHCLHLQWEELPSPAGGLTVAPAPCLAHQVPAGQAISALLLSRLRVAGRECTLCVHAPKANQGCWGCRDGVGPHGDWLPFPSHLPHSLQTRMGAVLAIPRPLEPFLRCRALPVQVAGWAGGLCVHRVAAPESDSW